METCVISLMNGARECEVNIMIQSNAVTVTKNRGGLKNYMLAVLFGSALGGVYAVAAQPADIRAQVLSPEQPQALNSDMVTVRRGGDNGATETIKRGMTAEPVRSWTI